MGNTFSRSRTVEYKFHKGSDFRSCEAHSYSRQKGHNRSVLAGATKDGHFACLAALIEAGADVNERDEMGRVALQSHKSNTINNSNRSVLAGATTDGHSPYVSAVLIAGANKHDPGFAHWQCVRLLIKAGANVNVRDKLKLTGRTPLHQAIKSNHDVCVEFLIEAGADVNASDADGRTSMVHAAWHNHIRCLELLIEVGADVNKPDLNGLTPLMCSAMGCGLVNETYQLKILLSAGASVNKRDRCNQNALELHISNRHQSMGRLPDSGTKTARLLLVAGERIDGTTVPVFDRKGHVTDHAPVPAEIIHGDPLCLRNICRETIRKRLIEVDLYTNLFHKIPQLPLPPVLHSYLLYDESLDRSGMDGKHPKSQFFSHSVHWNGTRLIGINGKLVKM